MRNFEMLHCIQVLLDGMEKQDVIVGSQERSFIMTQAYQGRDIEEVEILVLEIAFIGYEQRHGCLNPDLIAKYGLEKRKEDSIAAMEDCLVEIERVHYERKKLFTCIEERCQLEQRSIGKAELFTGYNEQTIKATTPDAKKRPLVR